MPASSRSVELHPTSRAGWRPLGKINGCGFKHSASGLRSGAALRRGPRDRPPPDPGHRGVTFLNGRMSDISIWWTQILGSRPRPLVSFKAAVVCPFPASGMRYGSNSASGFGDRRYLRPRRPSKLLPVSPHDRRHQFQPNADAAALIDISAFGGNAPDDIIGGQYPRRLRPPRQACLQAMQFSVLTKIAPSGCLVSLLGFRREHRVPTRRGKTIAATLHGGDGNMAQKGRGIFMVYVDIDTQHVQEFNKWYNEEHLPELLSVPGILSAARYEAVKGGPQYLACYELESVAVMRTPAFTNRPRTPWGEKVSPSVIGKNLTRIVGEQIYPNGIEMPERGMAPVLQIGRMSVPAEVDEEWNAWYSGEYVPGYRKVPGVIYARRYRVLEGTSGYSTVYEFASTAVPESPEWKEQQQHSSPNSPRMRQAMTHAPGSAGVYVRVNP